MINWDARLDFGEPDEIPRDTPRELGGYMLHGVSHVRVVIITPDLSRAEADIPSDGRVYMWESGALTIYSPDRDEPWIIIPAHRVVGIVGKEHG